MKSRYIAGHRDIAATAAFDARTERRRVDEDEQAELNPPLKAIGAGRRRDAAAIARAPAVKLTGTRAAIEAVSQAVALTGNNGLTRRNPLERHLRDVLCSRVHTPQDDSVVATAGRAAFPGL
jgi:alkylation response protein AidB-like acyl-CoA dehydrogenase